MLRVFHEGHDCNPGVCQCGCGCQRKIPCRTAHGLVCAFCMREIGDGYDYHELPPGAFGERYA